MEVPEELAVIGVVGAEIAARAVLGPGVSTVSTSQIFLPSRASSAISRPSKAPR